jgi:hypothetical protein
MKSMDDKPPDEEAGKRRNEGEPKQYQAHDIYRVLFGAKIG